MDNKNLFFGLGSLLIIIIILNIIGVLGQPSKQIVVHKSNGYYPPTFYRPPDRKTVVFAPDYYVRPNRYKHRYYN
jgi:hypothetical protein|uniref:Uncharacterized protein n=1 Tax=viral metagenome TaxID=1070528 RepID=A0A6C0CJ65_9ZZZZ